MDLQKQITALLQLNDAERRSGISLLCDHIFSNILNDPNNQTYHDLNFAKIFKRVNQRFVFIHLLLMAGFYQSDNGQRLYFDVKQLSKLKLINHTLLHNSKLKQVHKVKEKMRKKMMNGLLNLGYQSNDIIKALNNVTNKGNMTDVTDYINEKILKPENRYYYNTDDRKIDDANFRCNVSKCESIQRMIDALNVYGNLVESLNRNAIRDMHQQYPLNKITNDFIYAMNNHSSDSEFEYIYSSLQTNCNVDSCLCVVRNNRDRHLLSLENESKRDKLYFTGNNENDNDDDDIRMCVYQQIMDKIHCFYCHTYDIGYKLTPTEKIHISDEYKNDESKESDDSQQLMESIMVSTAIQKMSDIICKKGRNMRGRENNNKFVSDLRPQQINNDNDNEEKQKVSSNIGKGKYYSFGYAFWYWHWYKAFDGVDTVNGGKRSDWIVNKKYESFKQEITQNSIKRINIKQWDNETAKAQIYHMGQQSKSIKAGCLLDDEYGIKEGSSIQLHHILALMLYCNYDVLQFNFSQTLRKLDSTESAESMMQRNSHFYYLSRYLREAVQCFFAFPNTRYQRHVYHGISESMLFQTVCCVRFKGALSTTTAKEVAFNFANQTEGIILELYPHDTYSETVTHNGVPFFDCSWISDFPNEKELFFIGGFGQYFIFKNIIDCKSGIEMKPIMDALNEFNKVRDGTPSLFIEPDTPKLLQLLLQAIIENELHKYNPQKYRKFDSLYGYGNKLIENSFKQIWWVYMDWDNLNFNQHSKINKGYPYLKSLLCSDKGNWIKFDVINAIYPNMEYFEWDPSFTGGASHDLDIIAQDLLLYLSNITKKSKLATIAINIRLNEMPIFTNYHSKFDRIGFKVAFQKELRRQNDFHAVIYNKLAKLPLRIP